MFKEFSYNEYSRILEYLIRKRENLCFEDVVSTDEGNHFFILRHDIDYCPKSALFMAEIESNMGVRASYFLLFSSTHYNLLSSDYCWFPRDLVKLGHEVGLHYDLRCYEYFGRDKPFEMLRTESKILSNLTGRQVRSISMHEPATSGRDPFKNTKDFINAYDDLFTKKMPYFSDSCGAWSDEAVSALQGGNLPSRFQLLIHPFLWREEPVDRWTVLEEFIEQKNRKLREYVEERKEMWAKHQGVVEHDKRNESI